MWGDLDQLPSREIFKTIAPKLEIYRELLFLVPHRRKLPLCLGLFSGFLLIDLMT